MVTAILFLLLSTAGALASSPEQAASMSNQPLRADLTSATVTLPYNELRSLWEAAACGTKQADGERAAPPVDAVLLSGEYELVIEAGRAVLHARYRARTWAEGWHFVPLLGGDARLEEMEAPEAAVVWHKGAYGLLMRGASELNVTLRFALPPPSIWRGKTKLHLRPGPAALNRLRIAGVLEGLVPRVEGVPASQEEGGGTVYHFPAGTEDLVIALEAEERLEAPQPSQWKIQSELLVGYEEGKHQYQARVYAQADGGSGLGMELLLPSSALGILVRGDDIAGTQITRQDDGRRRVRVEWTLRDVLDRVLDLTYALPQSPLSTNWVLHAPELSEGSESRSLFVILAVDGLEYSGTGLKGGLSSGRLPEWQRACAGTRDFFTAEGEAEYPMQAVWLPRVATAQATVKKAEYASRLVADGSMLVTAKIIIEHRTPLSWRVQLPVLERMLACQVNRRPVEPIGRGDQGIEFPLAAPEGETTEVSFSYAARVSKLDAVSGRITVELPRTDLFIHELSWLLTIPEIYETTAVEGNVEAAAPAAAGPDSASVIRLRKELVQGESPAAEIYYQRRGLAESR